MRRLTLDQQWAKLEALINSHMKSDCHHHVMMLKRLKDDEIIGSTQYLGAFRAPAAKGNHHNFEGGWVDHLLEMWNLWLNWRDHVDGQHPPYITDERVLKAILYHDLHKVDHEFCLVNTNPWEVVYDTKHPHHHLMTKNFKTIHLLMQAGIYVDPEQMNALECSEGGWADTKPKWSSVLAKLVYTFDEQSGNVLARIEKRTFLDLRNPV